ncbi:MAG: 1-deoxy-D-xylulose-5-phosphate reductoisomerase [Campylobacter sp.]|nr:1-deoxy-D-xylulose-5-phosphate reductoisomerase [Campylobacter sp.]
MVILGSTGSIGTNSLKVAKNFDIGVEALSCNTNISLLNEQISKFKPKYACVADESLRGEVRGVSKVFAGKSGLIEMLEVCKSKTVINSLVGFAGLAPSIHIQKLNKTLALANKESLVVAGKFLDTTKISPIDSEHFGLKFLLKNSPSIKSLVITASGGAFRDKDISELKNATPADALKHPNWNMGAKITIDSATMANKLFEVMEAFWLFGVKNIDAVIEQSSSIHALINFTDGSTTAHLSKTDMKLAIAHALIPNLDMPILEHFDLLKLPDIKFKEINLDKYPIFALKDEVVKNPDFGVIINAANEIFVSKFLNKKCKFTDIKPMIYESLAKFNSIKPKSLSEIYAIDKDVRNFASNLKI